VVKEAEPEEMKEGKRMEAQNIVVNGKPRRCKRKFGNEYITLFCDVLVREADHFARKCEVLGKTKSAILRDLIQEFNITFGYPAEDRVKEPGSLYEHRAIKHIKESVREKVRKEFPWILSEN
jgi:hypothetical protein